MSEFQVITQSFVNIQIICESKEFGVEKRYPKDVLIIDLKNKLELITGLIATDMKLVLLTREKKFICNMDDDSKMLGFYPIEDGCLIEVKGSKTVLGAPFGEEDPNFKRYELTDEEYAKKKNTLKEFKEKNKLGQFSDQKLELIELKEKQAKEKIDNEKKLIEVMKVGSRCKVTVINAPTRLGTIMYLGSLANKPGSFVGVKYDEPLGKNDGSVDGKRYFECSPNYGGFVKPEFIEVGDFPEENFDDEF